MTVEPTRVALVCPYALDVFGGVQEQALAMSRGLSARGLSVLVLAPAKDRARGFDTPASVRSYGPVVAVPANGSRAPITLSPVASWRAREELERFGADVVHFHEPFAPLLGYAALSRHDVASVGTFHRAGSGPAYAVTRPLLRRLARGLDELVAVSEPAARTVRDEVGLVAQVAFNGFETERFREFAREATADPTVLFVGRLESRKGARTVLDAVMSETEPPALRLVVAGDGPEREALERRAAGRADITFLGAVSDEVKRRLLRQADVVVAASTSGESFGMVILEAMAAECPVVVSDIDGYRQAAGGHGYLFRPGDPSSLREAIRRALAQSSAATIAAAREHAEAWSMDALVELYLDTYRRATDRFERAR